MSKKNVVKIDVYQTKRDFWKRCSQFAILDTNWRSVSSVARHQIAAAKETAENLRKDMERAKDKHDEDKFDKASESFLLASEKVSKLEAAFAELSEKRIKFELDDADKAFMKAYEAAFDMNANIYMPFKIESMQSAFSNWCAAEGVPYRKGSDLEVMVLKAISGVKLAGTRARVQSNNKTWIQSRSGFNFMSIVYSTCVQYAINKGLKIDLGSFSPECVKLFAKNNH